MSFSKKSESTLRKISVEGPFDFNYNHIHRRLFAHDIVVKVKKKFSPIIVGNSLLITLDIVLSGSNPIKISIKVLN